MPDPSPLSDPLTLSGPSPLATPSTLERYHGSLLGLAIGDAMGAPLEFKPPGSFTPVSNMIGGGSFDLNPGEWTDDTSMALCLAESLIACKEFDPKDQLMRYCDWYHNGHLSSNGRCFDIGNTTRAAIINFEETGDPCSGRTDPRSAGNGSLMRLAPVPLAYAKTPSRAVELSGASSKTTHALDVCVDACRYMGALIVGAVSGCTKAQLLSPQYLSSQLFTSQFLSPQFFQQEPYWTLSPLAREIQKIANGSFWEKEPPEIQGTGYVVESLEAALWAFSRTETFEEGCLAAVNLGNDADTTGAIYGQLAGAYYGVAGIPEEWKNTILHRELIEHFSTDLFLLATNSKMGNV